MLRSALRDIFYGLLIVVAVAWLPSLIAGLSWLVAGLQLSEAQAQVERPRFYPDAYTVLIMDAETVLRMIALIAGGIWAYFKFLKGRIFHSRLEPSINGKSLIKDNQIFLHIVFTTKNVGLSQVRLDKDKSSIVVSSVDSAGPTTDPVPAPWYEAAVFGAFEKHEWVEPGETIQEERLILWPGAKLPQLKLEIILASDKLRWSAMTVVPYEADEERANGKRPQEVQTGRVGPETIQRKSSRRRSAEAKKARARKKTEGV